MKCKRQTNLMIKNKQHPNNNNTVQNTNVYSYSLVQNTQTRKGNQQTTSYNETKGTLTWLKVQPGL